MMTRRLAVAAFTVAMIAGITAPAYAAPTGDEKPTNTWTTSLSTFDDDDTNVTYEGNALRIDNPAQIPAGARLATPEGMLLLEPHELPGPATRVSADIVEKGAQVEVRGWTGDAWGEWREAGPGGAVLPAATTTVQVRIVLDGADAFVSSLRLTADNAVPPQAGQARLAAVGNVYRVYATREGLVGGTTANGHVIASRDHFVALPSRRGLAPKGTGDYTVRVCTTSGARCEFAPVWDVGPWNTTDDYWNPAATRQSFKDLPQGKPEAQAAYQDGYHNGTDGSGRTVGNPAGVDLADGVFWDGLQLTDNSFVNVAYLWTGSGPRGRNGSALLNIRASASSAAASKGYVAGYAMVSIECSTTGQSIAGPYGTTTRWDRIGTGQYISHAYVVGTSGGAAPAC